MTRKLSSPSVFHVLSISVAKNKFVLHGDLKLVAKLARLIPGYRLITPTKAYVAPTSRAAAMAVARLAETDAQLDPSAQEAVQGLLEPVRVAASHLNPTHEPGLPPTETGRTLLPHQIPAVRAIWALGTRALLADDMGLGKTFTALYAWSGSETRGSRFVTLLILCPAYVKRQWLREIQLSIGTSVTPPLLIDGTPQQRAKQFAELPEAQIVIINYDLLPYILEEQLASLSTFCSGGMVIFDESHYLKNPKAQRTGLCRTHLRSRYCLLLTGTPIQNTHVDLYSQISMLEPRTWRSHWEFLGRYCVQKEIYVQGGGKRKVIAEAKNLDELNKIVNCYQIRRLKEDVLDLPPKIKTVIELDMDPVTRKVYDAMRRWWIYEFADVDDSEHIFTGKAKTAMESALRLEQLCQGYIGGVPEKLGELLRKARSKRAMLPIPDRPTEFMIPGNTKVTWLLEHLEQLRISKRRCVVWFRFNAPMYWLQAKLGDSASSLYGSLTSQAKMDVIDSFQDGHGDVLLAQVKMGQGFDLFSVSDEVFFGRNWAPAVNNQAEDRCHRIGQKSTVNITIPIIKDGIEAHIHKRLRQKQKSANQATQVFSDLTFGEFRDIILT